MSYFSVDYNSIDISNISIILLILSTLWIFVYIIRKHDTYKVNKQVFVALLTFSRSLASMATVSNFSTWSLQSCMTVTRPTFVDLNWLYDYIQLWLN